MSISRRKFITSGLALTAGALAGPALPALARAAAKAPVRQFNFKAETTTVSLGTGRPFKALTYNSRLPGPEIRVKQGEIIQVALDNALDQPTTIHWHGIPLPNPMDGVPGVTQEAVAPGRRFVYQFKAEPAGTFFYHSHQGLQLDQGLYGPLIIEPSQPQAGHDREFVLMLEDWVMTDGGGPLAARRKPAMGMMGRGMMGRRRGGGGPSAEPVYDAFAVNGRAGGAIEPLRVKRGDRVKLRIINAASSTIFYLRLAGHALTITHADGNPVRPLATDVLRIAMGERYDVEFIADNPGRWLLAAAEGGWGESALKVPVIYQDAATGPATPPAFSSSARLANYWDLQAARPGPLLGQRPHRSYSQVLSGGMHSPYWTINGQVYPRSERLAVGRGELVRLSYFNRSMMPHPMHLHGHFFRVVNPDLDPRLWVWKDTVIVDRMQRVDIEFLADNPGDWLHHCHHAYHMEAGMINLVTYLD